MIDAFKADSLYIHGDEAISWTLDGEFGGEHKEVRIKTESRRLIFSSTLEFQKLMGYNIQEIKT